MAKEYTARYWVYKKIHKKLVPEVYETHDTTPRLVTTEDVHSWMGAASEREHRIWLEVETLLRLLASENPFRVRALRKELKWLRLQATKHDMDWGTKSA